MKEIKGVNIMVLHQNIITAYVGTYTTGKSKGIYRINFNKKTKEIEKIDLAYEIENPTYLSLDKERHILYSSCKINDKAGVISFKYWQEQDKLNLINYNLSEEKQPCHLSICSDNQVLLSSNYHENKMIAYNTLEGIILNYPFLARHMSPDSDDNLIKNPHFHCSIFTFDNKYILSAQLGLDKLAVYELNNDNLNEIPELSYHFPHGTGPRHIAYINSKHIYVLSELTSEVFVFNYNSVKNNNSILENIQKISSLPSEYRGDKSGAAIRIHPNKKFLYTSDRKNNSISLFSIKSDDGKLKFLDTFLCNGNSPRDFQIDPSGNYLFAANEKSDNISVFAINSTTGSLSFINSSYIPSPTCIEFI